MYIKINTSTLSALTYALPKRRRLDDEYSVMPDWLLENPVPEGGVCVNYSNTLTSTSANYTLMSDIVNPGVPNTTILRTPQGNEGAIHWKDRAIEVGGVRYLIDDLKRTEERSQFLAYMWVIGPKRWRSKYVTRSRTWKVWSVGDDLSTETLAIKFKPYYPKAFRTGEPAKLGVSVADEDSTFIILFLIYLQITEGPPEPRMSSIEGIIEALLPPF
ncbi:hypothetical protein BDZ94DRAFT_1293212 [Collybia nuda]|uniref:Uncharacterized protein n=1 Tax=Collybia nuda TaxID=64659 RepID=A0A9P6CK29_9AGAR|nr:hypothetical protein BDZ94DRAFT_1293212 [Collybia nuda]